MLKTTTAALALITIATMTSCSVGERPVPTRADTFAAIRAQLPKLKEPRGNNILPDWLIKACDEIGGQANLNAGGRTELSTLEMKVLTDAAGICVGDPITARAALKDLLAGRYANREYGGDNYVTDRATR